LGVTVPQPRSTSRAAARASRSPNQGPMTWTPSGNAHLSQAGLSPARAGRPSAYCRKALALLTR
jgi:hypothetical protein